MHKIYVGCDVSKAKIDFSIFIDDKFVSHREIENSIEALNEFITFVGKFSDSYNKEQAGSEIIFAAEYTGIYNNFLLNALFSKDLKIALLHPFSIRSMGGINRDKNDKIDSKRIAEYAMRFYDKLQFVKPKSASIEELKALNSMRSLLVKSLAMYNQSLGESQIFHSSKVLKSLESISKNTVDSLNKDIKKIDKEIALIIKNDAELFKTLKLLTSVPGIGKVTAAELIIYTENFSKFENAKKLGSYCGVVPFERSSGIFKGKGKVSKKANKSLKTLLHLGALSTIRSTSHYADYYNRRVQEGKNPMSVLNAIRNKMIKTAFAVVKKGKPYSKEYTYSVAS